MAVRIQAEQAKIGPETRFFAIFSSLVCQFSLKLHTMVVCNNVYYLVEVRPTKKISGTKFGPKSGPKLGVFCHFLEFGSLVILEIIISDSLQQCPTTSRGKTRKKNLGSQIWTKWAKISPKIRFFVIFSSLVHQFSCRLHRMIAWNIVKLLEGVKPMKKFRES